MREDPIPTTYDTFDILDPSPSHVDRVDGEQSRNGPVFHSSIFTCVFRQGQQRLIASGRKFQKGYVANATTTVCACTHTRRTGRIGNPLRVTIFRPLFSFLSSNVTHDWISDWEKIIPFRHKMALFSTLFSSRRLSSSLFFGTVSLKYFL